MKNEDSAITQSLFNSISPVEGLAWLVVQRDPHFELSAKSDERQCDKPLQDWFDIYLTASSIR